MNNNTKYNLDQCYMLSVINFPHGFFSRPYLSNGRAIGTVVVRPTVCLSTYKGYLVAKL